MNNIFDSHAHYDDERFNEDREDVIASLKSSGVIGVINCGVDIKSSYNALAFADKYDFFYAACGFHPEEANDIKDEDFDTLKTLLKNEKCVAVGEIGLDYYYDFVPREVQREVFERQLSLACELNLPVIIHDREAHGDTMELLRKYKPNGVLHCFSGSKEIAKEAVDLGLYIGFGGALTFKNAVKPIEACDAVPMDRILLETDCPYMAPVPMRGKRNVSSFIPFVAEKMAEIKGNTPQEILNITANNTCKLFNIKMEID